jgi:polyribonucleotide nucleotidyltransferase
VRLESFGAFVELTPGIEGLLHIEQLAGQQGGGAGGTCATPGTQPRSGTRRR